MKDSIRERLWSTRQQLFRLYDLESISMWKARDLLVLNELMEEFNIIELLAGEKKEREDILKELNAIKDRINAGISESSRDLKTRSILTKKLDKILTLIAYAEEDNIEGINRITATYNVLNRNDKQLLKALEAYVEKEGSEEAYAEYRNTVVRIREELEREIIELKKKV